LAARERLAAAELNDVERRSLIYSKTATIFGEEIFRNATIERASSRYRAPV
jgi:hypothetical protein